MSEQSPHFKFAAAVGLLVIEWAHLEHALDLSVELFHKHLGGNRIEAQTPLHLEPKLTFLGKCAIKLRELDAFSARITALVAEVQKHKDSRHDLIHGYTLNHPPENSEAAGTAYKMARRLPTKGREIKEFTASEIGVLDLTEKTMDTSDTAYRLYVDIAESLLSMKETSLAEKSSHNSSECRQSHSKLDTSTNNS